ncbi:ergothioneine biosynthesis protein EgtC [Streptomyces actinomycinicus]|uniref:Gamma-glutamyl-hercynylcysteine sulfoxide hydrolase n=1 Tax=Streptomyces actinomycinicus TaxID=1695166 RepID=A0A937EMP5_9ACTN|nr:ergothioneine biosynthesis protein EgtC [Streptomyces actinomycinicus]MBL1086133.1 ergothioneine biosynthesis protein EgtC [Streptomyces actinomycinicus]
MCRHLAYLGPEAPLGRYLVEPAHSLFRQSWAPRRQRYGTVNADGFGVGWYSPDDPVPARYRRAGPIWADLSFADLARVVRSGAVLAAVRDATLAGADAEAAAAPFAADRWLFSHNGAIAGWPDSAAPLVPALPPVELLSLQARTDSAFVWALVLHLLRCGEEPERALGETVRRFARAAPASRLNLLLTDGTTVTATAWGDTLWYRTEPGRSTVVASEPYDDDPLWQEVPDRTVLTASRAGVLLAPLEDPATVPAVGPARAEAPPSPKEPCR